MSKIDRSMSIAPEASSDRPQRLIGDAGRPRDVARKDAISSKSYWSETSTGVHRLIVIGADGRFSPPVAGILPRVSTIAFLGLR